MTAPKSICWLDLETTGTDENDGEILEVACVVTDFALREQGRKEAVVHPADKDWLASLNVDVLEMHAASGLIREVGKSAQLINGADAIFSEWLRQYQPGFGFSHIALAGSGVTHFDRRWIKRWMPKTDQCFTYWAFDVGVVRRFAELLGGMQFEREPVAHRAMADVEQSIAEARRLLTLLQDPTIVPEQGR